MQNTNIMEQLIDYYRNVLLKKGTIYDRYLEKEINWDNRLIAIRGARGAGKTSLLLKRIRENYLHDESCLYASLDHPYFAENKLFDTAGTFFRKGGKILFLDEVHKYPNWSTELKNIYDAYSELKVVFTSSSVLDLMKGNAALSRRMVIYDLFGLSFREFLIFEGSEKFENHTVSDLIGHHKEIAFEICGKIKPLAYFDKYLAYGYYPFYKDGINEYSQKLINIINQTIESDIPTAKNVEQAYIIKLKKLLYAIAVSSPVQPNINKLSQRMEVSRNTISLYLTYLHESRLISLLHHQKEGFSTLAKPEKVYLNNTNLAYSLAKENSDRGNLRETFFYSQLAAKNDLTSSKSGDFMVNDRFTFEIGGKNKNRKQITNTPESFIASDDIEFGYENKIPLWLFGFVY